jgi:hypothetical protein
MNYFEMLPTSPTVTQGDRARAARRLCLYWLDPQNTHTTIEQYKPLKEWENQALKLQCAPHKL